MGVVQADSQRGRARLQRGGAIDRWVGVGGSVCVFVGGGVCVCVGAGVGVGVGGCVGGA